MVNVFSYKILNRRKQRVYIINQISIGDEDVMILSIDGSALANLGKAGFGGLVRNHDGTFIK